MNSIQYKSRFTLLSIIALVGTNAFSKDFFAEKARIRLEVSKSLTDPSLIDEITEIRFKKEVLDKYVNVAQYPPIQADHVPTNLLSRDCRQAIVQFPPVPCSDATTRAASQTTEATKNPAQPLRSNQHVEKYETTEPEVATTAKSKLLIINSNTTSSKSGSEIRDSKTNQTRDPQESNAVTPVVVTEIAATQPTKDLPNSKVIDTQYQSSSNSNFAAYAGVGSQLTLGIESKLNDSISARLQYSGTPSSSGSKTINGSSYQYESHDQSVALLLDWYPTKSPLRVTGGLSLNNSSTVLNGLPNSAVNINGNAVNLGTDTYSIEYKLPKVTPYLGIGYSTGRTNESGLSFFGEVGIRLGKYNATTTTSLINSQNVKTSDLSAEMSSIQKSLYKWSFVPSAQVGLTYRFN